MTRSARSASNPAFLNHESILAGVITAQGKQGQAIAKLSDDAREAFAQQNEKIRELIALCQALGDRVDALQSELDAMKVSA